MSSLGRFLTLELREYKELLKVCFGSKAVINLNYQVFSARTSNSGQFQTFTRFLRKSEMPQKLLFALVSCYFRNRPERTFTRHREPR